MNRQGSGAKSYKLSRVKVSELLRIFIAVMVIILPQQFYPKISYADKPTKNELQATDRSEKFVLKPRGDANTRRSLENRTMYHTDLEPTGIFVKKENILKFKFTMLIIQQNCMLLSAGLEHMNI